MQFLHPTKKVKQMDTVEKFHIYIVTPANVQINDKDTSKPNAVFDTIIRQEANRRFANL